MAHHRLDDRQAHAEQETLRRVAQRLATQFPELPAEEVERAVHGKYETFTDSAVRDFVPVLVERASRRRLAERAGRRG